MTIITITLTIAKLKGFLSLFMVEINTGVFVAQLDAKVRKNIWETICNNIGNGCATICFVYDGSLIVKKIGKSRRQVKSLELCLVGVKTHENEPCEDNFGTEPYEDNIE
jgi:CRISPR-associated endoribonuclease Cas2 subtype I-E